MIFGKVQLFVHKIIDFSKFRIFQMANGRLNLNGTLKLTFDIQFLSLIADSIVSFRTNSATLKNLKEVISSEEF